MRYKTLDIKNNGTLLLKDNIDGEMDYKVVIQGDKTGTLYLQNDIRNAQVSLGGLNLNTINNQVHNYAFNNLTLTDYVNMAVDVDLANGTMDRLSATNYGQHTGTLNVSQMNLLSDAKTDSTEILFAESGLKDNVTTSVTEVAYSPIYKYDVAYDKSGENGMFVFARSGGLGNASDSFNPAVLAGPASTTVGAISTMSQTAQHSFNNSDAFMSLPSLERTAMKNRNKYAFAVSEDGLPFGKGSPLYIKGDEEASVWVKPYAIFESIPLKNGPKVSNISYGTLFGFDSEMKSLRHGWDRVLSGYGAYNGSSQHYSGVDSTLNGGLLGGTMTLYKDNFFNATTINVGASVANNQTMYGNDSFTMLMSGVANKTGYNLEFNDGKLILQPSLMFNYSFVNAFDYTNAAGVRIDNKPLHALQFAPGVKVIGNLKNGWQPYASASMVWNLMSDSRATANGIKLPEMSIKPYVQYGVGLQKLIKTNFTAYGQAMLYNGGRNGVALTAGARWAIGKDKD